MECIYRSIKGCKITPISAMGGIGQQGGGTKCPYDLK
jgi:hypothetical protein